MNVQRIEFDKTQADALYRAYKAHRGAHTKEDAEIERIYYQISRGRKVIRAHESIRAAGVDAAGRPKLALIRANVRRCRLSHYTRDRVEFTDDANPWRNSIKIPWPGYQPIQNSHRALVPMIPVHLRPSDHLERYHILWEADWQAVPVDPMLLRKIGGDAWIVVAAWDLTPIEQAVLAGRL